MKFIDRLFHDKAFLMAFTFSLCAGFSAKNFVIYFFHVDQFLIDNNVHVLMQYAVKFIFWMIISLIFGWKALVKEYIKDTAKSKKYEIFRNFLESKFFSIFLVTWAVCIYFITNCIVTYFIGITPRFMELM